MLTINILCSVDVDSCWDFDFCTTLLSTKNMGYSVGTKNLEMQHLLRILLAEFLGTMLLVIFGCGTAMQDSGSNGYVTKV